MNTFFKLICAGVLFSSHVFAVFTKEKMEQFYGPYFNEVSSAVNRTGPVTLPNDGIAQFNQQNFTLWVYQLGETASGKTPGQYANEYNKLVTFCKNHNIKDVIYFPINPASNSFFDPQSTDPNSLVQLMQSNPLPSTTTIQFLFTCSEFDYTTPNMYTKPTIFGAKPSNSIPAYMGGSTSFFPNVIDWTLDMDEKLSHNGTIVGIVVDPQNSCNSSEAKFKQFQRLANYMASYKAVNSVMENIQLGMTLGYDSVTFSLANLSEMPLSSTSLLGQSAETTMSGQYPLDTLPAWRPSDTSPLLDNIYVQVYEPDLPYIFQNLATNPTSAGLKMLQLLTKTPYRPGTGKISATVGSKNITGYGTQFNTEITLPFMPIGVIDNNVQKCLVIDPDQPSSDMTCAGKISPIPTSPSQMTLQSDSQIAVNRVPWLYLEGYANWRNFTITEDMINGITLMFSAESITPDTFFGTWTLPQFMTFVTTFQSKGQTFGLYKTATNNAAPVPNNFAIYTYDLITGTAPNAPSVIWFPGE